MAKSIKPIKSILLNGISIMGYHKSTKCFSHIVTYVKRSFKCYFLHKEENLEIVSNDKLFKRCRCGILWDGNSL